MRTLIKDHTTFEDREVIMEAFEITHEEWHELIFNYGVLMVETHHPKNQYVLRLKGFWDWYNAHVCAQELMFIHLIKYEKAVKHIEVNRESLGKNYCLGTFYIKMVRDFSIPRWQMTIFKNEYKRLYGKVPICRKKVIPKTDKKQLKAQLNLF